MKTLFPIFTAVIVIVYCVGCTNISSTRELSQEQLDSIAKIKEDSVRLADSIAAIEKYRADSIADVKRKEKEKIISKLTKKFRFNKDEFNNMIWVYHSNTPQYTNRNSIHLYFQKDANNKASNLRFRVQYEDGSWLFIKNMIFNVDGENISFIPDRMERDCGNGGRIWEWCDVPAQYCQELINKIEDAKTVKVKFNGRQYYDTKTMSSKELQAFKETLDYYTALDGR